MDSELRWFRCPNCDWTEGVPLWANVKDLVCPSCRTNPWRQGIAMEPIPDPIAAAERRGLERAAERLEAEAQAAAEIAAEAPRAMIANHYRGEAGLLRRMATAIRALMEGEQ